MAVFCSRVTRENTVTFKHVWRLCVRVHNTGSRAIDYDDCALKGEKRYFRRGNSRNRCYITRHTRGEKKCVSCISLLINFLRCDVNYEQSLNIVSSDRTHYLLQEVNCNGKEGIPKRNPTVSWNTRGIVVSRTKTTSADEGESDIGEITKKKRKKISRTVIFIWQFVISENRSARCWQKVLPCTGYNEVRAAPVETKNPRWIITVEDTACKKNILAERVIRDSDWWRSNRSLILINDPEEKKTRALF